MKYLAALSLLATVSLASSAAFAQSFRPSPEQDLTSIGRLVSGRMAAVQQASLDVELAAAETRQSYLFENPTLDLGVGTIPVGETNPQGLSSPYANVPNYGVGLSYRFLVGKRGPRQQRAGALENAARASREAFVREASVQLIAHLGQLAIATLRADGARGVLDDARRSVELARARLASTFGTPLDVDRLLIESQRVEQVVLRNEAQAVASLAACSSILGQQCEGFTGDDQAREYLVRWAERASAARGLPLEERPDLRALQSLHQAAVAEGELARAASIPDPTVRLGYLHDRFIVSGNQQNSLNLAVALPLPLFDHGQALQQAASSRAARLGTQRQLQLDAARARIPALRRTLQLQRTRGQTIEAEMLPRARGVLRDLENAAANRLVALQDVIQARRTVHELMMEETDCLEAAFEAALDLMLQIPTEAGASPRQEP